MLGQNRAQFFRHRTARRRLFKLAISGESGLLATTGGFGERQRTAGMGGIGVRSSRLSDRRLSLADGEENWLASAQRPDRLCRAARRQSINPALQSERKIYAPLFKSWLSARLVGGASSSPLPA